MLEQNRALVRRAVEEVWNRGNFAIVDELGLLQPLGVVPASEHAG